MSAPGGGAGLTPYAGSLGLVPGGASPSSPWAGMVAGARLLPGSAAAYDGGVDAGAQVIREHPDGVLVSVWVVPGASRDEVVGLHGGALRVRVSAPAEAGKANRAAAALVARSLGGSRGEVVSGMAARRKQVVVSGATVTAAREELARLLADG
jgi:uncharacterized protein